MESTTWFLEISARRMELKKLKKKFTSEKAATVSHPLLMKLTSEESFWMMMFKTSSAVYLQGEWSSVVASKLQLQALRNAVRQWSITFIGQLLAAQRTIMSKVLTGTTLAQRPSMNLDELIAFGKLDSENDVYTAAVDLEAKRDAIVVNFPNAMTPLAYDSKQDLVLDGMAYHINDLAARAALLLPNVRLVGAYGVDNDTHATAFVLPSSAFAADILHNGARIADSNAIDDTSSYATTEQRGEAALMCLGNARDETWTGGTPFSPTEVNIGQDYELSIWGNRTDGRFNGVAGTVFLDAGVDVDVLDGLGIFANGSATITTSARGRRIRFTMSATSRIVFSSVVPGNFSVIMQLKRVIAPGSLAVNMDDTDAKTVINRPTVRDTIGGGNLEIAIRALNFSKLEAIMNIFAMWTEFGARTPIYTMLQAHFFDVIYDSGRDSRITLRGSLFPAPLQSINFWFDSSINVGISKLSRQLLWPIYVDLMIEQLALVANDGRFIQSLIR